MISGLILRRLASAAIVVLPKCVKELTCLVSRANCISGAFLAFLDALGLRRSVAHIESSLKVNFVDVHVVVSAVGVISGTRFF